MAPIAIILFSFAICVLGAISAPETGNKHK